MNIIFVCTGNTCRSPMAAALANRVFADSGITGVKIYSAGVMAVTGAKASEGALEAMNDFGIDLNTHRSTPLSAMVPGDDSIFLTLSDSHLTYVKDLYPTVEAYLLSDYASGGLEIRSIFDPFGGDLATYRQSANEIERYVRMLAERISNSQKSNTSR